jgi:hypothetical protein
MLQLLQYGDNTVLSSFVMQHVDDEVCPLFCSMILMNYRGRALPP